MIAAREHGASTRYSLHLPLHAIETVKIASNRENIISFFENLEESTGFATL